MITVDDYTNSTKRLLKRYHSMQEELQKLDIMRRALADKIQHQCISPSISRYGSAVAMSGICNSPVESFVSSRIDNVYKLQEIDRAYKSIACKLNAVQVALGGLSEDDRMTLTLHYVDGLAWPQVADKMGRSRKWCSIVGNNAIIKLSLLLYGSADLVKSFSSKAGIG